jgi:hypothetical protein
VSSSDHDVGLDVSCHFWEGRLLVILLNLSRIIARDASDAVYRPRLKFSINHSSTAMRTGQAVLGRKLARFHKRSATDLFRFSKSVKRYEDQKEKNSRPFPRFYVLPFQCRYALNFETA